MADNMREGFQKAAQQASDTGKGLMDTATEKARDVGSTVGEYASQAKERVQDWANTAGDRFGTAREAVRDWGGHALENTQGAVTNAGEQVTTLIRSYPLQALFVGFGIGFILAHLTTDRR
jgi:ElaB/YqjD/DUF883 family membrane-anchored ribosome-binding protein